MSLILLPGFGLTVIDVSALVRGDDSIEQVPLHQADRETAVRKIIEAGQRQSEDRHLAEAIRILERGVAAFPEEKALRLELGRAYLANGRNDAAIRQFRRVLRSQPEDVAGRLALAQVLALRGDYQEADQIYRAILSENPANEAAAIGLASNLLHQSRRGAAHAEVAKALTFHRDSLRLQEYQDRIEEGKFGGEEEGAVLQVLPNSAEAYAEYFNDSDGNHSWRSGQRVNAQLRSGLTSNFVLEENLQYRTGHAFEAFQTSTGNLRWRASEGFAITAGAGAVRFYDREAQPLYNAGAVFRLPMQWVAGGNYARVPVLPNAESTEHKVTARGWDVFARKIGPKWHFSLSGSRQSYSDQNLGARESAEGVRNWNTRFARVGLGYQYQHYGFDNDPGDGYFSPKSYHSHLAVGEVQLRPRGWYQAEVLARGGFESSAGGMGYSPAWELTVRNEIQLRNWTIQLDYARYHLAQDTGAYRADSAQFAVAYHF